MLQRFWKYESVRGIIMLLGGGVAVFVSLYKIQFILHVFGALGGLLLLVEGAYQLFHDPVKKAIHLEALKIAQQTADAASS